MTDTSGKKIGIKEFYYDNFWHVHKIAVDIHGQAADFVGGFRESRLAGPIPEENLESVLTMLSNDLGLPIIPNPPTD